MFVFLSLPVVELVSLVSPSSVASCHEVPRSKRTPRLPRKIKHNTRLTKTTKSDTALLTMLQKNTTRTSAVVTSTSGGKNRQHSGIGEGRPPP